MLKQLKIDLEKAEARLADFERVFPHDKRLREALEIARECLKAPTEANIKSTYAAASDADYAATRASASAAAYAAACGGANAASDITVRIANAMSRAMRRPHEGKK